MASPLICDSDITRDRDAVPPVARRQAGVFTARQAREAGWSGKQVARRLGGGWWVVAAGRGLTHRATPLSPAALAWATQLSGRDVVLSHLTAGALHGFPVPIGLPGHGIGPTHHAIYGISMHRAGLAPGEVWRRGDLRLTSPRRTAIDCLATLSSDESTDLWAWIASRGILSCSDVAATVRDRTAVPGNTRLRQILQVARGGAGSQAERRMHDLLHRQGFTGWQANVRVSDANGIIGVVDILFAEARVVVEVDGWRAHSGRDAFQSDRRRQNRLAAAGYIVLRFTWDDIVNRPDAVAAELRGVLALYG